MKRVYVLLNITCVAAIIASWFGGHINSWVDIIASIGGTLMLNGMVYLFIQKQLDFAPSKSKRNGEA